MSDTLFPVLYILTRTDLPSMNAGKGMAQASHASNAFVFAQLKVMLKSPWKTVKDFVNVFIRGRFTEDANGFLRWVHSTPQGFGTVLVLAVNETQMRTAVQVARMLGFDGELVNDPTYPYQTTAEIAGLVDPELHTMPPIIKGGMATLFRSEDTCAYIFGDKNDKMLAAVVGNFPLHP